VTFGYDLERVRVLRGRTLDAVDAARRLRSDDPLAAEAVRAVAVLRRTLEDQWIPALLDIERSDAMVSWHHAGLAGVEPAGTTNAPPSTSPSMEVARCHWTPLTPLSDDELLEHLAHLDRVDERDPAALDLLAHELAARATRDHAFADRSALLAPDIHLLGHLAALARFPPAFLLAAATAMSWPHGQTRTADLDGSAAALSDVLAALAAHPAASLDLLLDPAGLYGVVAWERLDADAVTALVVAGLHGAVAADPDRLRDGYEVLRGLVALTNGPLDAGIHPGAALGVATSMTGYVDTLAPAIRHEGAAPVVAIDHRSRVEVEVGTYDDLVDLFGSLVREPAARAALGTIVAGYATSVFDELGGDVGRVPGIEHVARFADLLADAARAEGAELLAAAALDEAHRRRVADVIGFGVSAALTASGVGSVGRMVAGRAVSFAADAAVRVEAPARPEVRIGSTTHDIVTVEALRLVAHRPWERERAGVSGLPPGTWAELRRRLDEIDGTTDPDDVTRRVRRLGHWVGVTAPPLASFLLRVHAAPGMEELTEARPAVGPD
jgi:hypothetical protein